MKIYIIPIIIALVLLLCSFFIPMFDLWVGLIPTNGAWTASDTFEQLYDECRDRGLIDGWLMSWQYWPIRFHIHAWLPGLFLFVSSLTIKPKLVLTASIIGVVSMIWVLGAYIADMGDNYDGANGWRVIDPSDGNITIGYWIVLALFIVCSLASAAAVISDQKQKPET